MCLGQRLGGSAMRVYWYIHDEYLQVAHNYSVLTTAMPKAPVQPGALLTGSW